MVTSLRSQRPNKKKNPANVTGLRDFEIDGRLEQIGEGGIYSPPSLLISRNGVDRGGSNVLVPEGLLDHGQVNVLRDEGKSQRVLQAVGMTPIRWQPRPFSNVL